MKQTLFIIVVVLGLVGCTTGTTSWGTITKLGPAPSQQQVNALSKQNGMQVVQLGDQLRIIMATDGCFDLYTTTILYGCRPKLDVVANVLKGYGNSAVVVAGFTDAVGSPQAAKTLSKRQADSIVAYFWAREGIPYQRFTAIGYGQDNPIADSVNVDGSYYNRRIEITTRRIS